MYVFHNRALRQLSKSQYESGFFTAGPDQKRCPACKESFTSMRFTYCPFCNPQQTLALERGRLQTTKDHTFLSLLVPETDSTKAAYPSFTFQDSQIYEAGCVDLSALNLEYSAKTVESAFIKAPADEPMQEIAHGKMFVPTRKYGSIGYNFDTSDMTQDQKRAFHRLMTDLRPRDGDGRSDVDCVLMLLLLSGSESCINLLVPHEASDAHPFTTSNQTPYAAFVNTFLQVQVKRVRAWKAAQVDLNEDRASLAGGSLMSVVSTPFTLMNKGVKSALNFMYSGGLLVTIRMEQLRNAWFGSLRRMVSSAVRMGRVACATPYTEVSWPTKFSGRLVRPGWFTDGVHVARANYTPKRRQDVLPGVRIMTVLRPRGGESHRGLVLFAVTCPMGTGQLAHNLSLQRQRLESIRQAILANRITFNRTAVDVALIAEPCVVR